MSAVVTQVIAHHRSRAKALFGVAPLVLIMALAILGSRGAGAAAVDRLPNVEARPATDIQLVKSRNRTLLKFSTLSVNRGAGLLELRAGEINRSQGKQKVWQRIYASDGTYRDRLAGEFLWHRNHRHFHFENYARYELQPENAPGASQRTSVKTSFCIMDTDAVDLTLTGAPQQAVYTTCNDKVQGMSVGWGDLYRYTLAGQEIDVTNLPNGTYFLRIIIDPLGQLTESTTSDNVSTVRIELDNGTVRVLD